MTKEVVSKTGFPVRPYGTKTTWKGGGPRPKKGKKEGDAAPGSTSLDDIPKGPRKWYLGDDGKVKIVVLVGRFNKVVEVASFAEESASAEQLKLLASAKEAPELKGK